MKVKKPNKYDLAFLKWFKGHGIRIVVNAGINVWTQDDANCPFKVTHQMIERLHLADEIKRFWPNGIYDPADNYAIY